VVGADGRVFAGEAAEGNIGDGGKNTRHADFTQADRTLHRFSRDTLFCERGQERNDGESYDSPCHCTTSQVCEDRNRKRWSEERLPPSLQLEWVREDKQ